MIKLLIFLVIVIYIEGEKQTDDWLSIEPPAKSYFAGFDPPNDKIRWKKACKDGRDGNQVLLRKVLEQIVYPGEILSGDIHFGWLHRMGDAFVSEKKKFEDELKYDVSGVRAAITLLGYTDFPHSGYEGNAGTFYGLGPTAVVRAIKEKGIKFPKKIVGIGHMNENWGWLSTHILNRTCTWSFGFTEDIRHSSVSQLEQMRPLLDDPNLVMLLVNQHHNVSHPKVISLPRGVLRKNAKIIWDEALKILKLDFRKDTLLFSGSSGYRHRPYILECVKENMGSHISIHLAKSGDQNLTPAEFTRRLISSRAVLCLPGLGYDCWRIWESLLSGSMAVLEKGTGLDRSLYRLPALLLDDFADATPALLRQAYVEALYRADEWDYTRITERHWQRILYEASKNGNIDYMLRLHPMEAEDASFTRPLIPFDCEAMGGCGSGTKRVPKKSCSIDPKVDMKTYDWNWFETADEKQKKRRRHSSGQNQ